MQEIGLKFLIKLGFTCFYKTFIVKPVRIEKAKNIIILSFNIIKSIISIYYHNIE